MDKITENYRAVFGTETGQKVLADILDSLNYFSAVEPAADNLILHNKAKEILAKCGILEERNKEKIIGELFKLPVRSE